MKKNTGKPHGMKANLGFGTAPVFLTTISTILGAILFLRFGYAVAHVGFMGVVAIVILGHLVSIPTTMAVAEIATNQKVEGGGAYYIISRSFGLNIGGSVGISLYLSQAISVSFYIIAFAEAFTPLFPWLQDNFGIQIYDTRIVSLPAMAILTVLMLTRGANSGMKSLYVVAGILFIAIIFFLLGRPLNPDYQVHLTDTIDKPDDFFYVFIILFPAFTGIIAGLGLSGDLKDPKKSIPLGTISATVVGFIIYIVVAYKLAYCASPEQLNSDQLIMSQISIWGPIIPIGLAAACISSALGSIMVAPRTLQALSEDGIFQVPFINNWLSKKRTKDNEPLNASIITIVLAFFFISIGSVNFIAEIISMFFMVVYGAICLISFLEHFAADPAYRPSFKSKWQFSLIGAFLSIWLMFKMNTPYAILALAIMVVFYLMITKLQNEKAGLANIFQGVIFQFSRYLRVFLQKSERDEEHTNWRPSVVCISSDSFKRFAGFELLKWISYKYGFGTYIHYLEGYLSSQSNMEKKKVLGKLIKLADLTKSKVYLDCIISPSITTAIAQVIQLPSISGKDNNMILFEFAKKEPDNLKFVIDNFQLLKSVNFDVCILGSSPRGFGYHQEIHVWITSKDYKNANLMILMAYIILGHKDWDQGIIKLFAIYPINEMEEQKKLITKSIKTGRLPISLKNVTIIPQKQNESVQDIICNHSADSALTLIGFVEAQVKARGQDLFLGYDKVGNVLFVNTTNEMKIT